MDLQPYVDYKYLDSRSVPVDVQVGIALIRATHCCEDWDHVDSKFVRIFAKVISDHQVMFQQEIGTYHGFPDEFECPRYGTMFSHFQ